MARPSKFDDVRILGAAATLVAARGPAAATMGAIGDAIGAPNGSIYHRFPSRDLLLGRLWLETAKRFQDRWAAALEHPDARVAGLEAALSMPRQVRDDPEGARIMLLYRREDFLSDTWRPEMKAEAERLGRQTKDALSELTRRLFGRETAQARRATVFATLDIPFSAVRRYVSEGNAPPPQIDALIETAYRATIDAGVDAGR